ncbi:MAG TPA: ABC transporter ATP-binding protein [Acidimicrobiia bacterium]|nr:ABC transporter ATP-binding protein [Acidimicrobiia bacterium]
MTLLSVRDLHVKVGGFEAVRGIDFDIGHGSRVGLVGESGAGKSLTAMAIAGLLPEGAEASGRVLLDGEDLLAKSEAEFARIRGRRIAMVFQDPMTALNPLMRVGNQVAESLIRHRGMSTRHARSQAVEMLERVGLPDPAAKARAYPHELSGGQRQRVMISAAIACSPDLLIADEPTTALDATIQAEILELLAQLVASEDMALLIITHDLPVIASQCEEVIVLYGGLVMEKGEARTLFTNPRHPYSAGLLRSQPNPPGAEGKVHRLPVIPGVVPPLGEFPSGCPFRDRCDRATDECRETPPVSAGRTTSWCWHPIEATS